MTLNVFLPDGVETRYNVKATMRDGVNLSADIYYPRNRHGALPVILSRTPYDNMNERMVNSAIFYAQQGYIFVAQDTRGRNDSEGEFHPWVNEFNDGHDTVEWIGHEEWCDGNVGMVGSSYVGNVQQLFEGYCPPGNRKQSLRGASLPVRRFPTELECHLELPNGRPHGSGYRYIQLG